MLFILYIYNMSDILKFKLGDLKVVTVLIKFFMLNIFNAI